MSDSAPHSKTNLLEGCGLKVKGLISEVQHSTSKDGNKHYYSFVLIVPGSSPLRVGIKEGADPSLYREKVGTQYPCNLSVRQTQYGIFFDEV